LSPLKTLSAEPLIAAADDRRMRLETVKSTFSSRAGQIYNAAQALPASSQSGRSANNSLKA